MGAELDARSDLFPVGTMLYLLTTGRKPFDGETDLDVLMQVRRARYEKPSAVVKDFNPDVERFIARALRVNRERRWQSAEEMADRLDAILSKLGQQTGPVVLKRWLDTLSAKDGVKSPAEVAEAAGPATIEVQTRDLELENVGPPADEEPHERGPTPAPASTWLARAGRRLRRITVTAILLAAALGGGAYLARPYLPGWLVDGVKTRLRALRATIDNGL